MSTETTSDYRQTMDLTQLPESELCRMLTDCRITLESIRPYRDKATSAFQARLREEIKRRESASQQSVCPFCGLVDCECEPICPKTRKVW